MSDLTDNFEAEFGVRVESLPKDERGMIIKSSTSVYDFMKAYVRDMSIFTKDVNPKTLINLLSKYDKEKFDSYESFINGYHSVILTNID